MSLKNIVKRAILRNTTAAKTAYSIVDWVRTFRALQKCDSFGQCNEDKWLLDWLTNRGEDQSGVYVDIGANHPVIFSATYLLYLSGWRGVTVEPIPALCAAHQKMRPRDLCINAGVGPESGEAWFWETIPHVYSSFSEEDSREAARKGWCCMLPPKKVPILTPAEILEKSKEMHGGTISYLSIDTEGFDLMILKNWPMDEGKPKIISCEAGAGDCDANCISEILRANEYGPLKDFHTAAFWLAQDATS